MLKKEVETLRKLRKGLTGIMTNDAIADIDAVIRVIDQTNKLEDAEKEMGK